MSLTRRHLLNATLLALSVPAVHAQEWPTQPIKLIVPFAAGGGVDILARSLSQRMSTKLGQQMIVDNRTGAGGNVGVVAAAKAPADGYTLVMTTTGTHAINPGLYKSLPYDPIKDFAPISLVASVPNLLVVHPSVPAKDVKELIALAKNGPKELSFASFGNGTSNHLSGEMFKSIAKVKALHVPYKSATQAVTDLMAGQTDFAFVNAPLALPYVQAGKLRALAVTGAKRSPSMPEFPSMAEAGLPGFVVESWYGLMAPAGTPQAIVDRLNKETLAALADPEVRAFFVKQGADIETSTPEQFLQRIRTESEAWAKVIKSANIKVD